MENLVSILNFETSQNRGTDINSPRTLESCLRSGYDPQELYSKPKSSFRTKDMTDEMLELKYEHFERKRLGG